MRVESPHPYVVLGAGGHAKVVISLLRMVGATVRRVLDDDNRTHGGEIHGVGVEGPTERVKDMRDVQAIIAIGPNEDRERLAQSLNGVAWGSAVHPSAFVDPSCSVGEGTVVFAGSVIQADTVVGAHSIVNTAASIDHDCVLGDFVHVAPGVRLCGGVHVGSRTLLAVGSSLAPGVRIGSDVVVGAGCVVVRDIDEPGTYVGSPANRLPT